jgi:hypothetical protein
MRDYPPARDTTYWRGGAVTYAEAELGHAADTWARLSEMLEKGELADLPELYHRDALYLEPYNPPHRGNLLIHAYLKDYLGGKDEVTIDEKRVTESGDGSSVAVEWTISYTAGGRRWSELPRASFLELDEDGLISYHRDYS